MKLYFDVKLKELNYDNKRYQIKASIFYAKKTLCRAMGKNLGQITILVEIEPNEGIIGYGETAPTFASPDAIFAILQNVKSVILGQSITQVLDLMKQIFTH